MITPHPNENDRLEETPSLSGKKTVLLYLVAHCPLPATAIAGTDAWEKALVRDVQVRMDWARTVLHALFPVEKK